MVKVNHFELRKEIEKQMFIQGKNYSDIAKKTGYAPNTIARYMCGASDSKPLALALSKFLKINIQDYLGEEKK